MFINQIEDENGFNMMTSMTFEKSMATVVNGSMDTSRLYVGTNSGRIYTYMLNTQEQVPASDSIYLVE